MQCGRTEWKQAICNDRSVVFSPPAALNRHNRLYVIGQHVHNAEMHTELSYFLGYMTQITEGYVEIAHDSSTEEKTL